MGYKELKNLAMWSWDPKCAVYPVGPKSLRDFELIDGLVVKPEENDDVCTAIEGSLKRRSSSRLQSCATPGLETPAPRTRRQRLSSSGSDTCTKHSTPSVLGTPSTADLAVQQTPMGVLPAMAPLPPASVPAVATPAFASGSFTAAAARPDTGKDASGAAPARAGCSVPGEEGAAAASEVAPCVGGGPTDLVSPPCTLPLKWDRRMRSMPTPVALPLYTPARGARPGGDADAQAAAAASAAAAAAAQVGAGSGGEPTDDARLGRAATAAPEAALSQPSLVASPVHASPAAPSAAAVADVAAPRRAERSANGGFAKAAEHGALGAGAPAQAGAVSCPPRVQYQLLRHKRPWPGQEPQTAPAGPAAPPPAAHEPPPAAAVAPSAAAGPPGARIGASPLPAPAQPPARERAVAAAQALRSPAHREALPPVPAAGDVVTPPLPVRPSPPRGTLPPTGGAPWALNAASPPGCRTAPPPCSARRSVSPGVGRSPRAAAPITVRIPHVAGSVSTPAAAQKLPDASARVPHVPPRRAPLGRPPLAPVLANGQAATAAALRIPHPAPAASATAPGGGVPLAAPGPLLPIAPLARCELLTEAQARARALLHPELMRREAERAGLLLLHARMEAARAAAQLHPPPAAAAQAQQQRTAPAAADAQALLLPGGAAWGSSVWGVAQWAAAPCTYAGAAASKAAHAPVGAWAFGKENVAVHGHGPSRNPKARLTAPRGLRRARMQ